MDNPRLSSRQPLQFSVSDSTCSRGAKASGRRRYQRLGSAFAKKYAETDWLLLGKIGGIADHLAKRTSGQSRNTAGPRWRELICGAGGSRHQIESFVVLRAERPNDFLYAAIPELLTQPGIEQYAPQQRR